MTDTVELRRTAYLLLTAVAVAIAVAKVVGAENVYEPSRYTPATVNGYSAYPPDPPRKWPDKRPEPMPMFSSNDRSRWATVRALVDEGTYVVGKRENFNAAEGYTDTGIIFEDGYQSIDKVMNPATGEFYSSKPPLLSTLVAGEYFALKKVFGLSIVNDRWWVVCIVLLTINVVPFAVYLRLLANLIDEIGTTDFGRLFTFAVAAFGTYLIAFANTLNNHSPATYCVLFAVYPLLKAGKSPLDSPLRLAIAGFFAGLATTFELPAASLAVGLFLPMLYLRPGKTLLCFGPAAAVPVIASLACNVAALGTLLPAYSEFGGPWYNFAGSQWAKLQLPVRPKGIDFADEPKHVYAFHLLFGHHGWFSLTPAWLLAAVGLGTSAWTSRAAIRNLLRRNPGPSEPWTQAILGTLTLAVSIVVFAFYCWRTNNYGGFTSGPRWLVWLTPLWLLAIPRAADIIGKWRLGRGLAAVLLGFSVLSVFYPGWNPWRPPWVLVGLESMDWLRY